jgi:hypothetical protein
MTLGIILLWLVGSILLLKLWQMILEWLIDKCLDRIIQIEVKREDFPRNNDNVWTEKYNGFLTEESAKRLLEIEGKDMFI